MSETEAKLLIVEGFAREIVDGVRNGELRELMKEKVLQILPRITSGLV